MTLPYVPPPNSDELLSSWLERIGIFYGVGYLRARVVLNPSRTASAWGENEDFDSSDGMRRLLVSWTGYGENLIPPVLPAGSNEVLDVSARLAYCSECWREDARNCRAPYVRRVWAFWSSVLCEKHETWLCARCPGGQFGSELNGWAPVWQTDPSWADAAYLRYDPALRSFTIGFEAESILRPVCGWQYLRADIEALLRDEASILELVARPESCGVRTHVWSAMEVGARNARVTDIDLRGYRRRTPGWIADRICCLSTAVEIRRMIEDREPAFRQVRDVLETHRTAKQLLRESREYLRPTHNSCHFPARPHAGDRPERR